MRLLCDENIVGLDALGGFYDLCTAPGRELRAQDLAGVDALWVRSVTRVDAALLADTALRFVGTATAGTEHVDTALLAARGIPFCAAPGANANAVVEYVLAALAELGAPWDVLDAGGRLGIVGHGAIGQRLAAVAAALGWDVRVCDPWAAAREPGARHVSLGEVLRADVITLHCSLHRRAPWPSWHLLGAAELTLLDDSQWLINAARGPVVDNRALLARLASPRPPRVVLDVWEGEPDFDVRLLEMPSLAIATPHIAGYSWDSKWQATRMLLDGMARAGLPTPAELPNPPPAESLHAPRDAPAPRGAVAVALIRQRYAIHADDRGLRRVGRCDAPGDRASGFDALRRDYPQRRELRGSQLRGSAGPSVRALCAALGVDIGPAHGEGDGGG